MPVPGTVEGRRRQAREWRDSLNRRLIETRQEKGRWEDEVRGQGVQLTLEALDTLVTQTMMLNEPPPYDSALLLEDFSVVKGQVMEGAAEPTFPLFSALEDGRRSSPETAALLLRVMPGLKRILRHTGDWSHGLAGDFDALTEQALKLLFASFRESREGSGGGWGVFCDDPPQLYSTVVAVGALAGLTKAQPLLREEQEERARIETCLDKAHLYLRACRREQRYCKDSTQNEIYSIYSAYALQGLLALWDADRLKVDIERDVLSVLRTAKGALRDEPGRAVYFEDREGRRYEDRSGKWGWLRAVMLWLDRAPEFYADQWQNAADDLLRDLGAELDADRPPPVYLWNRAALSLASYECYAVQYWTLSNYELRKAIFELFGQRDMTEQVFKYVFSNVPKERRS